MAILFGVTFAFLLARYLLRDMVWGRFIKKYPRIAGYEQRLETHGFATTVALRLIPIFPFNALNLLLGVWNCSIRDYIISSFLGMVPGTVLFVTFGELLSMFNLLTMALAAIGIILLVFAGRWYERRLNDE